MYSRVCVVHVQMLFEVMLTSLFPHSIYGTLSLEHPASAYFVNVRALSLNYTEYTHTEKQTHTPNLAHNGGT